MPHFLTSSPRLLQLAKRVVHGDAELFGQLLRCRPDARQGGGRPTWDRCPLPRVERAAKLLVEAQQARYGGMLEQPGLGLADEAAGCCPARRVDQR